MEPAYNDDKKVFETGETMISWRKGKNLLTIEGVDVSITKQLFCPKIYEKINEINSADVLVSLGWVTLERRRRR